MPSTYTLNNGIELIATGEQSGTWGDTTNTNLSLVDTALDGQVTVTLPSAGTSGSPNTLAISDGAASDGRNRMVIFNDGGDLGATAYVQLTPNDAEKIIYVRNDLAGSRSIILFQGTYNASNDYEVPAGTTAVIYFDGGGSGAVAANVFNNAYFDSLRLGGVSVDKILDEDNMASDDASALATQQSIKAYVDSQVTAQDLDFGGDSGTGAVDLDSQTFTIAGTTNEIETSASGQTLTIGLPDDVTIAGDLTVDTNTLYVDSANNRVGIGTSSPNHLIDGRLSGTSSGEVISVGNITTGSFGGIAISDGGTYPVQHWGSSLEFYTGNSSYSSASEAMRIDSSGNLLVGKTAESGNTAGHFFSSTGYQRSTRNGGIQILNRITTDGSIIDFQRDGSAVGSIGSISGNSIYAGSGNVGVRFSTVNDAIYPSTTGGVNRDAATDLGISSVRFKDLYLSGTSYVTTLAGVNDTNTFIRFEGSDVMAFRTGNSERMRIDSSGNVGIGTTSPTHRLDVLNDGGEQLRLLAWDQSSSARANIDFWYLDGGGTPYNNAQISTLAAANAGNGNLVFSTRPTSGSLTERMRIDSSGNLLVANTTGASTDTGHIFAPSGIAFHVRDGGIPLVVDRLTDDGDLQLFRKDGTTVGSIVTNAGAFVFKGASTSQPVQLQTHDGNEDIEVDPDGFIKMETAGSERLRIDSSGNVGIGTSSPSRKVHVNGSARFDMTAGTIRISEQSSKVSLQATNSAENAFIDLKLDGGNLLLQTQSGGNVGIGVTSPSNKFQVSDSAGGSIASFTNTTSADLSINLTSGVSLISPSTGILALGTSNTERMRIDSSGNVGIATTSPSAKLHVDGNAIAKTDTDTTNTGSVTLDFGANQNFVLTLTGNVTLANPSTEVVGQSGFIVFIQDGTGGRTVSLGTDYETAGGAGLTLSSSASTTDVVPYIVAASGRILLGAPQLAFA